MKTSELRELLRKFGEEYKESPIEFIGKDWRVGKENYSVRYLEHTSVHVARMLVDYLITPIAEREDEKKYYVKSSIKTMSDFSIYLTSELKGFILLPVSQTFTQQEIDNFPAEIKGAIECGFLRKVEVE